MMLCDSITAKLKRYDWNFFFTIKNYIKNELNVPSERFLKSRIIDGAIEKTTNGFLKYIDQPRKRFRH